MFIFVSIVDFLLFFIFCCRIFHCFNIKRINVMYIIRMTFNRCRLIIQKVRKTLISRFEKELRTLNDILEFIEMSSCLTLCLYCYLGVWIESFHSVPRWFHECKSQKVFVETRDENISIEPILSILRSSLRNLVCLRIARQKDKFFCTP